MPSLAGTLHSCGSRKNSQVPLTQKNLENIVQEIAIRINMYNRLLVVAREVIAGA